MADGQEHTLGDLVEVKKKSQKNPIKCVKRVHE